MVEIPKAWGVHGHRRTPRLDRGRGTSHKRGYGSRWTAYTARFLGKTRGRRRCCIACIGTMQDAVLVDHIIPVRQDERRPEISGGKDEVFWKPWNHQPLCRAHHTFKTHRHDPWYFENRGTLLRMIEHFSARGAPDHEIRNWLIQENRMWEYGWFDLNPDPDQHMTILDRMTIFAP